jgi:phage terminase large subunit GpA-like protein
MMVFGPTETFMSDWSKDRLEKITEGNPEVRSRMSTSKTNNVVYYKRFNNGARVKLAWPTVAGLRGKEYRFILMTEYDDPVMHQRLDGDLFQLGKKRTVTFMSRGMTAAESSPNRDNTDRKYKPRTPHDCPPVGGIMDLYKNGNRKLWYTPCLDCGEYFIPDFENLQWVESESILESAESAVLVCPHCEHEHEHSEKREMNLRGRWLSEGQTVNADGETVGDELRSDTASYWFRGVMAAFQTWQSQVADYLKGLKTFEDTGDETLLKTAANINRAEVYTRQASKLEMLPDEFEDRAEELGEKVVPDGVLFLIMTIDVQANRFVVQVSGFGKHGESWIIDRFSIRESNRKDSDGEPLAINPASYSEDWEILEKMAIGKRYPLAFDESREMAAKLTLCDSGGFAKDASKGETVTEKAYNFYRSLRKRGKHRNFYLLKGGSRNDAPRVKKSYPDAQKKDRHATARGEIPVWLLNSNMLKDIIRNDLDRPEPGAGFVHFPSWLPTWFYNELTAETRTPTGWKKQGKQPNEAFDLICYAKAGYLILKCEQLDWDKPPKWAGHYSENPFVFVVGEDQVEPAKKTRRRKSISDIAKRLN